MSDSQTQSGRRPKYEEILTLAEAAEYLRTTEAKLAELATDGGVPARRIGGSGRPFRDGWLFPPHWLLESPFAEELLLLLEDRLLHKLKGTRLPPRPGSKEAVLRHVGVFKDDEDLEERLADARKLRQAGR